MSQPMGIGLGLLVALTLVSKEIIVFNAETVVAVSTTCTIAFIVKMGGEAILSSLDEQAKSVASMVEQAQTLERDALLALKEFYQAEAQAASTLKGGTERLQGLIDSFLGARRATVVSELTHAVESKFHRLADLEQQALESFQRGCLHAYNERLQDLQNVPSQGFDMTPLEGHTAYTTSSSDSLSGLQGVEGSVMSQPASQKAVAYATAVADASAETAAFWMEARTSDVWSGGDEKEAVSTQIRADFPSDLASLQAGLGSDVMELAHLLGQTPMNFTHWTLEGSSDEGSEGTHQFQVERMVGAPSYELLGSVSDLVKNADFDWQAAGYGPVEFYHDNDYYTAA
jgi:F0F1-type ATP synthase membrane subunit b/b'